ncbi:hypothetical protein NIES593_13075 [Hydrococcus rivularis NIES-593]|uniref:Type II secretion system protein GspC N-terminal domain-containing protein n=1 Tax=Hydrococcus rivularis NIES-593 TaxID=1921803 RepID=A0A1U7HFU0_9CYAN|nr:hypothetical protein [Hydrococcus rivularis]OKH22398.1 hypothetical protein NIES593_13075 [Hydrococcus rivularis NIES-593]
MKHIDKLLFAAASTYLGTVLFWLVSNDRLALPWATKPQPQPVTQTQQVSLADARFIAYLERSLERIKAEPEKATAAAPAPPTVAIPPAMTSSEPPPPPENAPTIIEKIYVPVYPQAPPTSVEEAPKPASTAAPSPKAAPVAKTDKADIALVGVLESGDRSYALFNVKGTTRRFEPGEVLGASGWTLVGIQNQQAIVHSNGATRSLEVGQGF